MATLFRTTGFQETVIPANGKAFSLRELQTLVGGYIEIARTHDGLIMVLDEEGKLKSKPINHVATTHYRYGTHDLVVGDVVVGNPKEMGEHDDDDDEEES